MQLEVQVSRVQRAVDERFLSVTLDAALLEQNRFIDLLRSPKLRTLSKALSPAFVRFGGTTQDFLTFIPHNIHHTTEDRSHHTGVSSCDGAELPLWLEEKLMEEWGVQSLLLRQEELRRKYKPVQFSEHEVDLLHSFADCSGLDLIFGLNALLRTEDNVWNSTNAALLIRYCQSQHYHMSWELGNEPNSFEKKAGIRVNGSQLGRDFLHLRKILQQSELYRSSGLYGPDVGQPRDHRRDLLTGFLETAAEAIDACTWHHYYVNGRDATLDDFLDPGVLDTLAEKTNEVLEVVESVSPGKKVWLGETSSAYGGGAAGLSDTFVAGFMWLDKLGLGAKLGLDVVMRQVLVGAGTYHLVDDHLDPLPDYWLSLLYKRLVGPEVLKVEISRVGGALRTKQIRVYLHCTNRNSSSYRRGAVTLFILNLSKTQISVRLPPLFSNSTAEAFILQSGEEQLLSRTVKLNGVLLKMLDERTLPPLDGVVVPAGGVLDVPALSLSFFVITHADAPVC